MVISSLRERASNFCLGLPCQCLEHYSFYTFSTADKLFTFLDEVVQCQAEVDEFVNAMNTFPPIAVLTWGDDIDETMVLCIPRVDHTKKPKKYTVTTEGDLFPVFNDARSGEYTAFSFKKHFTILKTIDADTMLRKCQDFIVQHNSNVRLNGDNDEVFRDNEQ